MLLLSISNFSPNIRSIMHAIKLNAIFTDMTIRSLSCNILVGTNTNHSCNPPTIGYYIPFWIKSSSSMLLASPQPKPLGWSRFWEAWPGC